MFDIIYSGDQLFGEHLSYCETALEASAEYKTSAEALPDISDLRSFLNSFRKSDVVDLSIRSYIDFNFHSNSPNNWETEYHQFLHDSEDDDEVDINLHIKKNFASNQTISVYCLSAFVHYYAEYSLERISHEISNALKIRSALNFIVLDEKIQLSSHSIRFTDSDIIVPPPNEARIEALNICNHASFFYNKTEYQLTPFDFKFSGNYSQSTHSKELFTIIDRMQTLFSYIYVANSAYINDNQLIMELSPASPKIILPLNILQDNPSIRELFFWAFENNTAVDRAGIIRNVLALQCHCANDLLHIEQNILTTSKSNYVLFQRKILDKYLDLKKEIGTAILEATNCMQDIFQSLVDAFRNNCLAVIMFLVTVIITDSINWEDLKNGTILNKDLILVIQIFLVSSFIYWFVAIAGVIYKVKLFTKSYDSLKENYSPLLDKNDLDNAFDNDKPVKSIKKNIIISTTVISVIWNLFLFIVWCLMKNPI